jgi:hypothetical protein
MTLILRRSDQPDDYMAVRGSWLRGDVARSATSRFIADWPEIRKRLAALDPALMRCFQKRKESA